MTRRTRAFVVFGVAIASAGLASAAVHRTLQQSGNTSTAPPMRAVVVAVRALSVGAPLTAEDVTTVMWPPQVMREGLIASREEVVGRVLIRPLASNEPVSRDAIAADGVGSSVPNAIPPGMRAISVKVNDVVGVAGFAVPGSRVDVLVALRGDRDSLARAVASNVQVLAVGTRSEIEQGRTPQSEAATVVTLLVAPADAERITLASMQGSITLTLRNPLDPSVPLTSGVRLAALVGQEPLPRPVARPRPVEPIRETAPPAPQAHVIETIRAGKRSEERVR
jgi:pilus assembly protein CpaB